MGPEKKLEEILHGVANTVTAVTVEKLLDTWNIKRNPGIQEKSTEE